MTLGGLIPDVRVLLNDTQEAYRWGDGVLAGFLRDAVARLNNIRPSTRYVDGVLTDIEWPADLRTFQIPGAVMRWRQGFVYYAAARALEVDASDTVNQSLAVDFMAKAEARFQA